MFESFLSKNRVAIVVVAGLFGLFSIMTMAYKLGKINMLAQVIEQTKDCSCPLKLEI